MRLRKNRDVTSYGRRPGRHVRARRQRILAAALPIAVLASGCGGGDGEGESTDSQSITVWTVEDLTDRVEAQQEIVDAFAEETGIEVELVAIAEDQLNTVLASAAAGDDLPDVIGALSLNKVNELRTDDLLDTETAAAVVEELGVETFSERALELTQADGEQLSVPSDGWAQMLFYRQDLFDAAGLDRPDNYDAITAAAEELNSGGRAGIVAATAPADSFTHQTFEHLALANDCQLVDDDGEVALDSDNCQESFGFYTDLMREYSVPGNQDADTTRAAYFNGNAAMVVWSSFLLDELAGLRNDALPNCPECATDPLFLANNTGVVTGIEGPDGSEPASYGEVVSWAPLVDSNADAVSEFVNYMMSDAYLDWLAIAPEGKLPTRTGTSDDPEEYLTAWQTLPAGVDTEAPLSDVYDAEVLDAVAASAQGFSRWGLEQGQGELAGAVSGQFVVSGTIADLISAGGDVGEAVSAAAAEVQAIKDDLG